MVKKIAILAVALVFFMLFMTSCFSDKNTTASTEGNTTTAEPKDESFMINLLSGDYSIVRANKASSRIITAGIKLRETINEKFDSDIKLYDEFTYESDGTDYAIIVGITGDAKTTEIFNELKYDEFIFRVIDKNLYIVGGSDLATEEGVDYFLELFVDDKTVFEIKSNYDLFVPFNYPISALKINGNDISAYTIIYSNASEHSKTKAQEFVAAVRENYGITLNIAADTATVSDKEILFGNTNRTESSNIITGFARKHVYYNVSVVGNKLVFAFEGPRSGDLALNKMLTSFNSMEGDVNLTSSAVAISGTTVADAGDMFEREAGTSIRIMQSNVLFHSPAGDNAHTDRIRAEIHMDIILTYLPDVITFNEFEHGINPILREYLKNDYIFVDHEYEYLYDISAATDRRIDNLTNSCPIAYRKDAGLTVIDAKFRHTSNLTWWHNLSWALFEDKDGNRFLSVSVHLPQNQDGTNGPWFTKYADEILKLVDDVRRDYGMLPVVMGGDWFFWKNTAPYEAIINGGFMNAGSTEEGKGANIKYTPGNGTFHDLGVYEIHRVEEDLIFYNPEWFEALGHAVIYDKYAMHASDHYPVLVDLKFTKSAKAADIPAYDDGLPTLEVEDGGEGGSGDWNGPVSNP